MDHVERFRALMAFEPVDRLPWIEWAGFWNLTVDRWRQEGLSPKLEGAAAIRAELGLDPYRQQWVAPKLPRAQSHGAPVIRNPAEYEALLPEMYPDPAVNPDHLSQLAEAHDRGQLVFWFTLDGFFWFPRKLMGIAEHMLAFYDQPELMHRVNEDLTAFNLRVVDEICSVIKPEFMTIAEDMSYNHGPMLSKSCFDTFLAPYYRRLVPRLKEYGIVPMVDSDGDIMPLIPWLEEVGVEGILPLERMAGVDVAEIRRRHPRWKMIGAFDKMVMKKGATAMREEFERLLPVMRQGGFIPSVDHQTPPDVSLDTYRDYVSLLQEYAGKAASAELCAGR